MYLIALLGLGQYKEVAENMTLDSEKLGFKFQSLILVGRQ